MKERLLDLTRAAKTPLEKKNRAREYLQSLILQSLQRAGAMTALAFHGGSALRFLYSLPRYSEDLDFALERRSSSYDFRGLLRAIQKDLTAQGYAVSLKANDQRVVQSAFIRFQGIPYELNLSPHPEETLAVKIEIDTRPPAGATLETALIRRFVTLHLQHHDKPSLLAGKLHAVLQRPYLKGRDLYDLAWYLSDPTWPPPNLKLLNNALTQTHWEGAALTSENWREVARAKLESISFKQALADVSPFLETTEDLSLLTKSNLLQLLQP